MERSIEKNEGRWSWADASLTALLVPLGIGLAQVVRDPVLLTAAYFIVAVPVILLFGWFFKIMILD